MVEPKAFQDALLAYHARPCDAEAEAVRAAVTQDERERCAQLVPTNWCDELLTGKNGLGKPPYYCPDIERLLRALAAAIRAGNASVPVVVPTPQQISDYLNGLDAIQREVVEREARAADVMGMGEARVKRISDALRTMQEMWDHLRRKGISDVLMRQYSSALGVLETDLAARLPDGVPACDGGQSNG